MWGPSWGFAWPPGTTTPGPSLRGSIARRTARSAPLASRGSPPARSFGNKPAALKFCRIVVRKRPDILFVMVERTSDAPSVGLLDGARYAVQKNGDVWVYNDASDPNKRTILKSGGQVIPAGGSTAYVWNADERKFHRADELSNAGRATPDVFPSDTEKTAAASALTSKMNALLAGMPNTPGVRGLRASLEGKIGKVNKPSEASALDKHLDDLAPDMELFRRHV